MPQAQKNFPRKIVGAVCAAAMSGPLFTALSSCTTMSDYSVAPHEYPGIRVYQVFCSSCHGLTGHGDGPVKPYIRGGVPDLTQITARHGGQFPEEEIRQIVDGRRNISAHGTSQMPVWGYEFHAGMSDDALARRQADETVRRVVDYLKTLQPDFSDR